MIPPPPPQTLTRAGGERLGKTRLKHKKVVFARGRGGGDPGARGGVDQRGVLI